MMRLIFTTFAETCVDNASSFFGIPTWYKYLQSAGYMVKDSNDVCQLSIPNGLEHGDFEVFVLIGLGVLDIIIRIAGLVAVAFVVYGGILYVTSRGEPDKAKKAMGTIINALIGLVIAVVAAAFVAFLGGRLSA
jgi:hypothetical protein